MKKYVIFVWFLMVSTIGSAMAQDMSTRPSYYSVHGVAANDVLNMREAATAASAKIGELAHNAAPVEVLFITDGWGYVSSGESSGYVSMAFMTPFDVTKIPGTDLPQGLSCGGTEPFWDADFADGQISVSLLGQPLVAMPLVEAGEFHNLGGSIAYLRGSGGGAQGTAVISNRMCSDGMSDRDYAREISLLVWGEGETIAYAGCCMLPTGG